MRERYIANLAGRGMKIGDLVVCTYRVPSANQWWTAPFHVGVIQDVEEPVNASVASDARHCAVNGYVKVSYLPTEHGTQFQGFTQLDSLGHILPLNWSDGLTHSPYFSDGQHDALIAFASKCGLADYYKIPVMDEHPMMVAARRNFKLAVSR